MRLIKTVDAGYNRICPPCGRRWHDGIDRRNEISMERCEKCAKGGKTDETVRAGYFSNRFALSSESGSGGRNQRNGRK